MPTTADLDAHRQMSYQIAEAIAPTWERRRAKVEEIATPVREWMVRRLAPGEGDTVLELAAGAGDTGFEAAAAIGERGLLLSTDFSPRMLEAARRRGAELGVKNVDYRVIDAESIELDEDTVDGVLCRFGYMLLADPAAALGEARRVLRPAGRLALGVWGSPERNPYFTAVVMALVQAGHLEPPDPETPGLFSMASEERTQALLAGAGFEEVTTEEVEVRFELASIDAYVAMIADTAGPIGLAVRALSEAARDGIKSECEAMLERFAGPDGHEIPGVAVCAVAM